MDGWLGRWEDQHEMVYKKQRALAKFEGGKEEY